MLLCILTEIGTYLRWQWRVESSNTTFHFRGFQMHVDKVFAAIFISFVFFWNSTCEFLLFIIDFYLCNSVLLCNSAANTAHHHVV